MTEHGKIVNVKDGKATVRFMRTWACDSCGMCLMRKKDMHMDVAVDNKLSAAEGDTVAIEIKEGGMTLAAVIIYAVPLIVMLGAMLLAVLLSAPEYIVGVVAVGALVFAYAVIFAANRIVFKKWKIHKKIEHTMLRIVKKGP